MEKKQELENTMAAALAGLKTEKAEEPPKPKKVRKSHIETEPLPEPKKKRTRKKKDPALKKTHTFTLLMTEQLYQRFKATAEEQGMSMNGIATQLIKKYIFLHDVDERSIDV